MTGKTGLGEEAVAAIIKGVTRKTAIIVSIAVLFVLVNGNTGQQPWWLMPASILFGGALGLLNFRFLASTVEQVYLRKGVPAGLSKFAAMIISMLKLSAIFAVLFIVVKFQVLHILGTVAGFSLCFLAILWEGVLLVKNTSNEAK
jgi:hypothetical protein